MNFVILYTIVVNEILPGIMKMIEEEISESPDINYKLELKKNEQSVIIYVNNERIFSYLLDKEEYDIEDEIEQLKSVMKIKEVCDILKSCIAKALRKVN